MACSDEACFLCGAGCWMPPGTVECDHDCIDRHTSQPSIGSLWRDTEYDKRYPWHVAQYGPRVVEVTELTRTRILMRVVQTPVRGSTRTHFEPISFGRRLKPYQKEEER